MGSAARGALEQHLRLGRLARVEHADAKFVEDRRVIGYALGERHQDLVRLTGAAGGGGGLGRLQSANYRGIIQDSRR